MTAILRSASGPMHLLTEAVDALADAIDGAITGAAIGWLERRGYHVEPKGERGCQPS